MRTGLKGNKDVRNSLTLFPSSLYLPYLSFHHVTFSMIALYHIPIRNWVYSRSNYKNHNIKPTFSPLMQKSVNSGSSRYFEKLKRYLTRLLNGSVCWKSATNSQYPRLCTQGTVSPSPHASCFDWHTVSAVRWHFAQQSADLPHSDIINGKPSTRTSFS